MWGYVFVFEVSCVDGTVYEKRIAAPSKQMGWVTMAAWVACHTMNPSVVGIKLSHEMRIAKQPNYDYQLNRHECDHQHAVAVLCNSSDTLVKKGKL